MALADGPATDQGLWNPTSQDLKFILEAASVGRGLTFLFCFIISEVQWRN